MVRRAFTRRAALAAAFVLLSLSSAPVLVRSFVQSPHTPLSSSASHRRTTTTTTTTTTTITKTSTSSSSSSTSLHIFGGLKDAFTNDDSLGKAKDAGLSSGPRYNDQVTVNGKPITKVVVDQKISLVCNAARVKVPYNCQNGECGTCTVKMNGKKVRACVAKVPAGKCAIQTL